MNSYEKFVLNPSFSSKHFSRMFRDAKLDKRHNSMLDFIQNGQKESYPLQFNCLSNALKEELGLPLKYIEDHSYIKEPVSHRDHVYSVHYNRNLIFEISKNNSIAIISIFVEGTPPKAIICARYDDFFFKSAVVMKTLNGDQNIPKIISGQAEKSVESFIYKIAYYYTVLRAIEEPTLSGNP